MNYRKAEADDVPVLVALRKQQLLDEGLYPVSNIDRPLTDYFKSSLADGSLVVWLAIDEGRIAATGGVCFYRLPPTYSDPTGRAAYVTAMYTEKAYRRQGIGTRLLDLALGEARARGCRTARLHASIEGKPLYRKAGFVDSGGYMSLTL